MKVTFKPRPDGEALPYVLADDSLGFRSNGSKFVVLAEPESITFQNQAAAYPRADEIETFRRGNAATIYRVIVDYQFSSIGDRTRFQHRVADYFTEAGILEILHDKGGIDALECVLQTIQKVAANGLSLTLQFTFLGGLITAGPANTN